MQVSEVMQKSVVSVTSLDSVRKVARIMKDQDIGAIPVIEKGEPIGFVTERDIVINCVASGYNLDGPVSHAMSEDVISVQQDQDVEEASKLMEEHQISRILVTDKERHPVGMIGLKDLRGETFSKIKQ